MEATGTIQPSSANHDIARALRFSHPKSPALEQLKKFLAGFVMVDSH